MDGPTRAITKDPRWLTPGPTLEKTNGRSLRFLKTDTHTHTDYKGDY